MFCTKEELDIPAHLSIKYFSLEINRHETNTNFEHNISLKDKARVCEQYRDQNINIPVLRL